MNRPVFSRDILFAAIRTRKVDLCRGIYDSRMFFPCGGLGCCFFHSFVWTIGVESPTWDSRRLKVVWSSLSFSKRTECCYTSRLNRESLFLDIPGTRYAFNIDYLSKPKRVCLVCTAVCSRIDWRV